MASKRLTIFLNSIIDILLLLVPCFPRMSNIIIRYVVQHFPSTFCNPFSSSNPTSSSVFLLFLPPPILPSKKGIPLIRWPNHFIYPLGITPFKDLSSLTNCSISSLSCDPSHWPLPILCHTWTNNKIILIIEIYKHLCHHHHHQRHRPWKDLMEVVVAL